MIAVHDSPKPPPTGCRSPSRRSTAADEIWFVASGDGKAEAVGRALGGADREDVPVGRRRAAGSAPSGCSTATPAAGSSSAALYAHSPRRARSRASASSRMAAPSSSVRRSFT